MEKSYERFLFLAAKYPPSSGKMIHPTYAIDCIWHVHMIHPLIYKKDCQELVGYLMDHEPWPKESTVSMNKSFKDSSNIWQNEFSLPMEEEHIKEAWDGPLVYDD